MKMPRKRISRLSYQELAKRSAAAILLLSTIALDVGSIAEWLTPPPVYAAQVSIDTSASSGGVSHLHSGPQTVFISDQTGYKFYRDSGGNCAYNKTTDGGDSWNTPVSYDAQTDCEATAVWYDRWTPNDTTGTYIHIVTMETASNPDKLYYNRLDTSSDTLLNGSSPTNISGAQGGTFVGGTNYTSITKATNGTLYATVQDASDSYVVRCSTTCQTAGNWSEVGTSPYTAANDYSILMPLTNGDVMVIDRVVGSEDIQSKIWNNTAGSWSSTWTMIDPNAFDNTTYDVGIAATLASSTVAATTTVYLAYVADNNDFTTQDHDIRIARYQNGVWSTSTSASNPTRNAVDNATGGLTNVAISRDQNTGNVYVAYNRRTTIGTPGTANTYWKMSTTTTLNSWTAESSAINTSANDIYGVDLNLSSDQRIYATWFGVTGATVFGNTIADLVPGVTVATTSSQVAQVAASTSNFYVGGAFVLTESISSRNVTGITIEESGTVDAQNALTNIKLLYESDTAYPYDCATNTYNGTESQFGSTDTNGFSGSNGTSAFTTGASITVATTSALCVYVVMDVLDSAANDSTINIRISNPSSDVTVSPTAEVSPATALDITGSTTIKNDIMTQTHFHFRNDDGNEALATSRTSGTQDTALAAIQQGSPLRIRLGLSNEGGTTTPAMQFRLEYSLATTTCSEAYLWGDVGATADEWDMYNTTNLTEGNNTTNITTAGLGAITDENTSFITANGGVRDVSSQTGNITATTTQFVELEYSVIASTTAAEGNSYCFRVTNAGSALPSYLQYPKVTISADVTVSATSSQTTPIDIPATNQYIGGGFVIKENSSSRTVSSITITEGGTVDGTTGIDNIKLYYDLDIVAPFDCTGESYVGGATQYGTDDTDGFSTANGTSTFTGSVTISTTQTLCLYVVLDTTTSARNGETLDISIAQPSTDVVVSGGGSVAPSSVIGITGSSSLRGPVLTQTHYHWRNDNGTEAGATSATGGVEDTALSSLTDGTPARLRMQVSNEGATTSYAVQYLLEYAPKVTTCAAATGWTDVGAGGGAFDMYNSANLTDGNNTTNIAVAQGGVTDENSSFLVSNTGVKDTSSLTSAVAPTSTQFVEFEYAIEQTVNAGYSVSYCFRLTNNGTALDAYSKYAELTTAPQRDFKVQRNFVTISGTSATITAGVDYVAPAASTSAFIRITNSQHTGAGNTAGSNTQDADNVTAYIQDASNITSSVTFARAGSAISDTRVYWEIVEFIGTAGTDNEIKVRQQQAITFVSTDTVATATAASGIVADDDIAVFVTGMMVPDGSAANYNTGLATAAWSSTTNEAVFTRGEANSIAAVVSFAIVEFTGAAWRIQRAEHTYGGTSVETEDIQSVNSLARTFIHTQKRTGAALENLVDFGHEVWLSSVGQLSLQLQSGAGTPSGQTTVVWIIENTQSSTGAMLVTRSNGFSVGGSEPLTSSIDITTTIADTANSSIFLNNRAAGTGTNYPRPILGVTIASTTHYEIWRSDTVTQVDYRTEVVEWPVAGLAFRQNDYRLYVDNNALTPTDPWPLGGTDLGENTPITAGDLPPGDDEVVRIRVSIAISNASFPTSTQAFKLQFGARVSSCSAIASTDWRDLGDAASSTVWRGYAAAGTTDGATLTSLVLGVSDVAGTLEEENTSVSNPNGVPVDRDIEYDWYAQMNGAPGGTTYCFRMVKADGTALDGYNDYPQIRTASFSPRTQNWRWYADENNETPTVALGVSENTTPIDIGTATSVKLRVTVKETKGVSLDNTRFKLQYSEYSDFSTSTHDLVATSTCIATSTWCYYNGADTDNAEITTKLLSDADACTGGVGNGCGTHNESALALTGFRHEASAATEYEFTVLSAAPRVNRTYYFRLYDISQDAAVVPNTGETYPSLMTEGAQLSFATAGLATSTSVEGVTTDIGTTPTRVSYGDLPVGTVRSAAQRFTITTNATEGYQLLMYASMPFTSSNGEQIAFINASNTAPAAWSTACAAAAQGCYGYHAGDDSLADGSSRFAPNDTYAAFETTPREVGYSSIPAVGDTTDVVYRVLARTLQPAGQYEADIVFVSLPQF